MTRCFPPVGMALPGGLLQIGGQLTTDWLLEAYSSGIFPWPHVEGTREVLAWYSPDPRAIVELDRFHASRRLQRRIRADRFCVTIDRAFDAVVRACAEPRQPDGGTWITPSLAAAFGELHRRGFAHSVEVWADDELVGGVYGMALGGFFAGESMFHRRRDTSKIALAFLVNHLQDRGYTLFDVQQSSSHLASLGATEIPRAEFLQRLRRALPLNVQFTDEGRRGGGVSD